MAKAKPRILAVACCACWFLLVLCGVWRLWRYEGTVGQSANAPDHWPLDSSVRRLSGQPTLILFAHPQCPCTRATIGELARLMAHHRGQVTANVLMLSPTVRPDDWADTSLWSQAESIPGISVRADSNGEESRRFGAATSGQVLLYSSDGKLLFSGGITESRGHSGDNAGESALDLILSGMANTGPNAARSPVYGCSLFDWASTKGAATCQK